ncbi:S1/P1 nuclease [Pseudobythopirellula maris]|uniref:S1/P1 nuclease n=1 Tax=Pseudobythopirellula maris TaxID=2527991 RepID=UPI0018D41C86|nr:S1/P1 nuclease [Pseudobythopirellula maris]
MSIAHAWNGPGHQTIDLVAWSQLAEADQAAAIDLLRDHPRFEQHFLGSMPSNVWAGSDAEIDAWIFAHAGTWPDQVRSARGQVTRDDVRRYGRSTWHYVNLWVFLSDSDRDALAGKLTNNRETEPTDDRDDRNQNVVQAIGNSLRIIDDPATDRQAKAVSLCWFLHLAGDVHQPLHSSALYSVGRFPAGDRGGNSIPVRGHGGDLHALWDRAILPRRTDFNRVRKEALDLVQEHAESGKAAAAELEPKQWAVDSWRLARAMVYTDAVLAPITAADGSPRLHKLELPTKYLRDAGITSKHRAVQAGYRIAETLKGRLPAAEGVREPLVRPAEPEASGGGAGQQE